MTLKQTQDGKFNLGDKVRTIGTPAYIGTIIEIPEWCPNFPVVRLARGLGHIATIGLVKIEGSK